MFDSYVALLALSGIVMIAMALIPGGQGIGARALNGIFGIGFAGYAFYLVFIFESGTYLIFFKAFILPVVMIFNFGKSFLNRNRASA